MKHQVWFKLPNNYAVKVVEDVSPYVGLENTYINPDRSLVAGIPPHYWKEHPTSPNVFVGMEPQEKLEIDKHHEEHGVHNLTKPAPVIEVIEAVTLVEVPVTETIVEPIVEQPMSEVIESPVIVPQIVEEVIVPVVIIEEPEPTQPEPVVVPQVMTPEVIKEANIIVAEIVKLTPKQKKSLIEGKHIAIGLGVILAIVELIHLIK